MYKLSPELSKKFDIFYIMMRKIVITTTLRTMQNSLIPALLLLTHHERKLTASDNLLVSDVVALQRLAVELHALNIAALRAITLTLHGEYTTLNVDLCLVNEWHTEHIATSSRLYRVETERGHDIPCRHLTYVLVTRKAIRLVRVHRSHNLVDAVGSLPWLTKHSVEVDDMVAWLVAVNILANKTRDIWRYILALELSIGSEEAVELLDSLLYATEALNEQVEILRNKPQILPCVTLTVLVVDT